MSSKKGTKIAAIIALVAILGSVVGTGALVIFETLSGGSQPQQQKELSQEELNELFKTLTGVTVSTGSELGTGTTTLTGTTK